MKSIVLAMLSTVLLVGCNDSFQTTGATGGNPSVASAPAEYLNKAAKEQKRAVKTADIAAMNKALESFYVQEGRFPKDLMELVEKNYLPRLPVLPDKAEWDYDTNAGVVGVLKN
ncbi:MAG: hypothetical protein DVB33_06725 [Verrucomicrobia bacterium]|jgi:hypothetical protein|nr:MAG: hypothetical protein DVB33_06725 [Verrucomicrobiota bacterium]